MKLQHTINAPTQISGAGLFTGEPVEVKFKPAEANTGVVFVRSDQEHPVRIPAVVSNVTKRARRTSLKNGTVSIETVEHCLSACAGLGIDNIEIELTGGELPGVDGSGQPFVERLQAIGLKQQNAERRMCRILRPIQVEDGDARLLAFPGPEDTLHIIYELDYSAHPGIGHQIYKFELTPDNYVKQIAPARTFLLREEAEQFRAAGMGQHLTYRDVLVFGENGPIENELRFPDECVRHKILDLIGDLMLLGEFIAGTVYASRSGHSLNHELVRRIQEMADTKMWESRLASAPLLDIRQIQRTLPHRYPLLMVDRILEIEGTRRAVGVKNVTINEEYFQGHYPGQPIMPGVLILEAMAQLGGVLLGQALEHKGKVAVLLSMDNVKFRRPVTPGDQLILEAEAVRVRQRTGHVRCQARVGDALVAEAEIKFMLVDADPV